VFTLLLCSLVYPHLSYPAGLVDGKKKLVGEKLMNDAWLLFTKETLPPPNKKFHLLYKGFIWESTMSFGSISGRSPCGEIILDTSVGRILEHDLENKDQTKWRVS